MKVDLAGFNIDMQILRDIDTLLDNIQHELSRLGESSDSLRKQRSKMQELLQAVDSYQSKTHYTPETLSASYARISRDPASIPELREIAREQVEQARKSNRNIVFGMGHHSIAEHAVFNFDIMGISRLAIEALQSHRLASYTEKSQRYITLRGDYLVPYEFQGDGRELFEQTVKKQNQLYALALPVLEEHQRKRNTVLAKTKSGMRTIEGWAKEDARYALSLATQTQVGMTANARTVEYMIRRMRYHPLDEVRQLGEQLYGQVRKVAPSLILLTDPEQFKQQFNAEIDDSFICDAPSETKAMVAGELSSLPKLKNETIEEVRLIDFDRLADRKVAAAIIFNNSDISYYDALEMVDAMGAEKIIHQALARLSKHDAPFREFELPWFLYELVVSATCFAQLKRHRMMTLLAQGYDTSLAIKIPPAVVEAGLAQRFIDNAHETEQAYYKLAEIHPQAAEYILTNGHRRRVVVGANARELYHIARLRMDSYAQWDIRAISSQMLAEAKKVAPTTMMLACGKDNFDELKKRLYEQC